MMSQERKHSHSITWHEQHDMLNLFHEKQVDESKGPAQSCCDQREQGSPAPSITPGNTWSDWKHLEIVRHKAPHQKKVAKTSKLLNAVCKRPLSHLAGELPLTIYPVELPTDKL